MDGHEPITLESETQSRETLGLPEPYRAPGTAIEHRIAGLWAETLGIDRVGLDDDFFDLGGDSLSATEIVTAASAEFHTDLQPAHLMTLSTVAVFAEHLARDKAPDLPVHIAPAPVRGPGAPVFFLHGKFGLAFPNPRLTGVFQGRRPVYYVSAIGFYDDAPTPKTLEATAAAYLASIRQVAGDRGFHLVGMCRGAGIAHEMGRQADLAGDPALSVTLIDPPFTRLAGLHPTPAWVDRAWRGLRISRDQAVHSVRLALGLARGEYARVGATRRQAGLLGLATKRYGTDTGRIAAIPRRRLRRAQKTLEVMFAGARHEPWRGPAGVLVSRTRNAMIDPGHWPRLKAASDIRVLDATHREVFNDQAATTGALLIEFIEHAEANRAAHRTA